MGHVTCAGGSPKSSGIARSGARKHEGRFAHCAEAVRDSCGTSAGQLRNQCGTAAEVMRNSCGGEAEKLRNGECEAMAAVALLLACSNTAHPPHSRHHRAVSLLHQASGIATPQQRETGQIPPRPGSAGTRPKLGRPSHRPPCSKFEQQQTAEEAAALVVLCARKHRRRARLLTLIS